MSSPRSRPAGGEEVEEGAIELDQRPLRRVGPAGRDEGPDGEQREPPDEHGERGAGVPERSLGDGHPDDQGERADGGSHTGGPREEAAGVEAEVERQQAGQRQGERDAGARGERHEIPAADAREEDQGRTGLGRRNVLGSWRPGAPGQLPERGRRASDLLRR